MQTLTTDFLIIGSGIIGLTIAKHLIEKYPDTKIIILEKEKHVAYHSSGRNSGVLHAGFYYTANSLKAKFTRRGNELWREYCYQNGLKINECKKVVVAKNEEEIKNLYELANRAKKNQVPIHIIDEKELQEIEPNAKTYQKALFSPLTATVDPIEICNDLYQKLKKTVQFLFTEPYVSYNQNKKKVRTKNFHIEARQIINCAGLYADKIARDFELSYQYEILPFKGLYLQYCPTKYPIRTNIYPVPNLHNPFLGVHFTITVNGDIKLGPTAIPAFWREHYSHFQRFRISELYPILYRELQLLITDSFSFRKLAFEEMKKYRKKYLIKIAKTLVHHIEEKNFPSWTQPGIRAQLIHIQNKRLIEDFVIEKNENSIHILNAVSPAFTAALPFTQYVVENYIT